MLDPTRAGVYAGGMPQITSQRAAARHLKVTPATIRDWINRGWLPPQPPWDTETLDAAAAQPRTPGGKPTSAPHGTVARYDAGCICPACVDAHNEDVKQRKRDEALEAFNPMRARVVRMLSQGATYQQVYDSTGVSSQQLHGLAEWNQPWQSEFHGALMAGRRTDLAHGTPRAYRKGCRCPECAEAKRASRK